MARIDELAGANYNRIFGEDLGATDHVYRAVPERMVDIYRAQGSISGRGGAPTYFSIEGGVTPQLHASGAQMSTTPQVLLRIPSSEISSATVARPNWGTATRGWEYHTNSYPQWGTGGYRQFMGTTENFSDDWIVRNWSRK